MTGSNEVHGIRGSLNPVLMMIAVIVAAVLVTYVVGAGRFERHGGVVVAGTYKEIPKIGGLAALTATSIKPAAPTAKLAHAASIVAAFASIPAGLALNFYLIVLVFLVGGMFGVLRQTGALDAGIDRLIHATGGNKFILVPVLMIVLGAGSTFLGFIPEYLVVIPIVGLVGSRLGYNRMFSLAVVGVAAKIGYATSVTNPVALVIAQPLAHVPLFSGMEFRFALFVIFMSLGIGYVLYAVRPVKAATEATAAQMAPLSTRHLAVVLTLLGAAAMMVVGFIKWHWGIAELSTYYVFLSFVFAIVGRLKASVAADAFVDGLKNMMLSALLVGLAGSVQYLLQNSFVLDTMISDATGVLRGLPTIVSANGLMVIEMALGVLIPSTSGKVAMSMPILAPIAHLAGVTGQTTVLAFILGNGLTNMVSPTTGMLLAYIATAKVSFGEWIRFIAPLFVVMLIIAIGALATAVLIGY
jgi:uncharacterized ion transporter superfamily protein YfcC